MLTRADAAMDQQELLDRPVIAANDPAERRTRAIIERDMLAETPTITQRAGAAHFLLDRRLKIAPRRIDTAGTQRHRAFATRQSIDGDIEAISTDLAADRA